MTDRIKPVNPCPRDAWELFHAIFADGDEVVVIDDDDEFHWGRLEATPTHCLLKRPGLKTKVIDWDVVRFVSHDGFPVRKLMGADGSALFEQLDTRDVQKAVREALELDVPRPVGRYVFGDPYEVEGVEAELVNPGVPWTPDNWRFEETLMLYAGDGARGLLWHLPTVYHAEIVEQIGRLEVEE